MKKDGRTMELIYQPSKPVLIIYPPYENKTFLKSRPPFPVGPLYISAYLRENGIDCFVKDFSYPPKQSKIPRPLGLQKGVRYSRFGMTDEEILCWLNDNLGKYHSVVGVSSLMSSNYTGAYKVIGLLKRNFDVEVVCGGPHATIWPEHIKKYTSVDYICTGEGEDVFYKFLIGKRQLSIKKSEFKMSKLRLIPDIETLPFLNRDQLLDSRKMDEMYVTFSRGCPHKCSFCGSHLIQGRFWRHKSVDFVISELFHYISTWRIKKFVVEDDNLCPGLKGVKWLKELCLKIKSELPKLKFHVSHGLPLYALADSELSNLLWEVGFRKMSFPLESASVEVLRDMKKENTVNDYPKAIKNWKEKNPPTGVIFGYPFVQNIETMLYTLFFISKYKGVPWVSHFRLNKGTELFDRCVDAGYVSEKLFDPISCQTYSIETERFRVEDLVELSRIGQAVSFCSEIGFDLFRTPLDDFKSDKFNFIFTGANTCDVASGSFKFRRGQQFVASVLYARKVDTFGMCPVMKISDSKIVSTGRLRPSRVYQQMIEMLRFKNFLEWGGKAHGNLFNNKRKG